MKHLLFLGVLLILPCLACRKSVVAPSYITIPAEPELETANLPDTATPEQTQDAQTRDLVRWVGYSRELRALLLPFSAPSSHPKKEQ